MTLPELVQSIIALGVRPPLWRPIARIRWTRALRALSERYRLDCNLQLVAYVRTMWRPSERTLH